MAAWLQAGNQTLEKSGHFLRVGGREDRRAMTRGVESLAKFRWRVRSKDQAALDEGVSNLGLMIVIMFSQL